MAKLRKIETAPGLVFDALDGGAADAPLVLLLHGFSESLHMWRAQVPALAAAGYRAVAPSQRGYSPLARPDPANAENYQFDRLVADAIDVVAACGHADRYGEPGTVVVKKCPDRHRRNVAITLRVM